MFGGERLFQTNFSRRRLRRRRGSRYFRPRRVGQARSSCKNRIEDFKFQIHQSRSPVTYGFELICNPAFVNLNRLFHGRSGVIDEAPWPRAGRPKGPAVAAIDPQDDPWSASSRTLITFCAIETAARSSRNARPSGVERYFPTPGDGRRADSGVIPTGRRCSPARRPGPRNRPRGARHGDGTDQPLERRMAGMRHRDPWPMPVDPNSSRPSMARITLSTSLSPSRPAFFRHKAPHHLADRLLLARLRQPTTIASLTTKSKSFIRPSIRRVDLPTIDSGTCPYQRGLRHNTATAPIRNDPLLSLPASDVACRVRADTPEVTVVIASRSLG